MKKIYTEPITAGVRHKLMLPKGTALVLEGGGTRGFYSAGVFDAFMDAGIMFPYIIGVSAGAANALSYISGQRGRNRVLVEKFVGRPQYLGYRNLFMHRSLFGYDYVFKTVPERHLFWDRDVFDDTDTRFIVGAVDCATGKTVWFEKHTVKPGFDAVRASCSIPIVSPIAKYKGHLLLDGGVASPIPIEKSIEDGNGFHVIVLTQNEGYEMRPFKPLTMTLTRLLYRKYPHLVEAMRRHHEVYNRQLRLCEQMAADGRALIIRPRNPLTMESAERNITALLRLHDEGYEEGKLAVQQLFLAVETS
jgi:predicted patatin/cPLA2 family phospholipase